MAEVMEMDRRQTGRLQRGKPGAAAEAVGPGVPIVLDSGIRHGADIAVGLCQGADLCMIGRAYLYGLAAAGESGVRHAIDLLTRQLRRTMQLLGVTTVAELRDHRDELITPAGGIGEPLP
jgi:L-lactate dehydrogenase (cytochrome)